jgi:hypothetical protein
MKRNWINYLFVLTLLFFTLGFVNIIFAWLALVCLILPFILLAKDKKKTWCQKCCPRSNLFSKMFQGRSLTGKPGPDWLVKGKGKWILLAYFSFNLFVITMSTIRVSMDLMEPLERVRFLIAFILPWEMPQLLSFGSVPDWVLHLSFRLYSMMFTTVVLGLVLGWLFYPRTWCRVCPINTVSDITLNRMNNSNKG